MRRAPARQLACCMKNTATFRRGAAAVGLVTTALLMVVSTVFAPEFPDGFAERLAAIEAAGSQGKISAVTFALAQLPFLVGVLGIAHMLRERAPILSNLGASLAVIGGFGHSVVGGVSLVHLSMAADAQNRAAHAAVVEAVESGPAVPFLVMGLLGTVLGILLLAIGLWRARIAPRWVGPALGAFLVVEFAGQAISQWASLLSVVLYLVAFTALAVTIWRSPAGAWASAATPAPPHQTALAHS